MRCAHEPGSSTKARRQSGAARWAARVTAALGLFVSLIAAGCSEPEEAVGTSKQAVHGWHGSHGQTAGTCPGGSKPTLKASVVGLVATKSYGQRGRRDDESVADSRCLVDPIAFVVPRFLAVTKGDAGKGRAELSFRDAAGGRVRTCEYRGTSKRHERSDRYELQSCEAGVRGGASLKSSYFRLEIESSEPDAGVTEVRLQLGTPNPNEDAEVTPGEPELDGVVLEIPPGAASVYEQFELSKIAETEPSLPLNYGVKSSIAAFYGVKLESSERPDGSPLPPTAVGEHFRLTLPYDPAALAVAGGSEDHLLLLEVSGVLPWSVPEIIRARSDFDVDRVNHTITFDADSAVGYISAVAAGARSIPHQGGPVMHGRVPVHFLYYGNVSSYRRTVLQDFVRGLGASNWLHILDSYNDVTGAQPTADVVMGEVTDVPNPDLNPATDDADWVEAAVQSAIDKHALPWDGNAIYLVIAGADANVPANGSCGWHTDKFNLFAPTMKYGLIKNGDATANCITSGLNKSTSPNRDRTLDTMVSVVAHEIAETLTDPEPLSGWVAKLGSKDVENADNCAWMFGDDTYEVFKNPVPTKADESIRANVHIGIRDFLIQQNWVNVGRGYGYCGMRVENDDARVASFATTLPAPPAGQDYHPMIYGATYRADIDYQNIGDTKFRDLGATGEQYVLGSQSPQDNDFFGVGGRVPLGAALAPGATRRFSFNFNPSSLFPGLDYTFQWRMVREAVRWFGESTPAVRVRALFDLSHLEGSIVPPADSSAAYSLYATFKNTSGAAWRAVDGYHLVVDAGGLAAPTRIDLAAGESVEPGATKTFTVSFTTPAAVGSYPIQLRMEHDGVGRFGDVLDTTVRVAPTDRAEFVEQSVPTELVEWQDYEIRVTFKNTGSSSWEPGFRLSGPGVRGGELNESVAPGASHEFKAFVQLGNPGVPASEPYVTTLVFELRNASDRVLASTPGTQALVNPGLEIQAECVYADLDVPTTMVAGHKYLVHQTMKNIGQNTWPTSYYLASTPPGDEKWGIRSVPLTQSVLPGSSFRFELEITAPPPGAYLWAFMMYQSGAEGSYFFRECQRDVEVTP